MFHWHWTSCNGGKFSFLEFMILTGKLMIFEYFLHMEVHIELLQTIIVLTMIMTSQSMPWSMNVPSKKWMDLVISLHHVALSLGNRRLMQSIDPFIVFYKWSTSKHSPQIIVFLECLMKTVLEFYLNLLEIPDPTENPLRCALSIVVDSFELCLLLVVQSV